MTLNNAVTCGLTLRKTYPHSREQKPFLFTANGGQTCAQKLTTLDKDDLSANFCKFLLNHAHPSIGLKTLTLIWYFCLPQK